MSSEDSFVDISNCVASKLCEVGIRQGSISFVYNPSARVVSIAILIEDTVLSDYCDRTVRTLRTLRELKLS